MECKWVLLDNIDKIGKGFNLTLVECKWRGIQLWWHFEECFNLTLVECKFFKAVILAVIGIVLISP